MVNILVIPTTKYIADVVVEDVKLWSVDERVDPDVKQDHCSEIVPNVAQHVQGNLYI